MNEHRKYQDIQYRFAAHIRDPQHVPAPEGIEDRRMAIYRDLFFNNLKSLLSSTFPVLKKLLADDKFNFFAFGESGSFRDVRSVTTATTGTMKNSNQTMKIGAAVSSGESFDGIIDEARISGVARSADWVAAQNEISRPFLEPESSSTTTAYT